MARLGGAGESSPSRAVARRFYNIPDVALIESRGSAPYFNIAIGSGYRGHPLETDTQDRFYSLRDYRPFQKLPQTVYNGGTWTVATDSTLVDVTNSLNMVLPVGAPGWKLEMRRFGWVGEKVLSESITASGVILFTTFTPLAPDNAQPCLARTKNRVYAVQAINGSPAFDINGDGSITTDDYSADLRQDGVPPSVTVLINNLNPPNNGDGILPPKDGDGGDTPDGNEQEGGPGDPGGGGNPPGGNPPPGGGPATNCTIGVEAFGRCPTIGQAVRTFWLRRQ
jgi:type IV pilus assembly protein PilY1